MNEEADLQAVDDGQNIADLNVHRLHDR